MANQQNEELHTKKQIIVIRREHLWDDLQNLEYILGGNATINSNIKMPKGETPWSEIFNAI